MRSNVGRRGRRTGRALAVALAVLLLPTAAGASSAPAGHSAIDGRASRHAPYDGPVAPGIAWRTDLGFDLAGRVHEEPFPVDGDGIVYVSGRIENHPDLSGEGYLNAVDTATGDPVWAEPGIGIDATCHPVVTDDGRVLVQLDAGGVAHPGPDSPLIAVDARTGERIETQEFTDDSPRLNACPSRLVLVGDTVLVPYGGASSGIRAVDISSVPWVEAWSFEARTDADTAVNSGRNDQVVVNAAQDTAYYLSVKDATSPPTWQLSAIRIADGSVRDTQVLPGRSAANQLNRIIAVDGGVVVALQGCDGEPVRNETGCVTKIADDGASLSIAWTERPTDPEGKRQSLASLTDTGTGVVAGWTLGTGRIYGLSLDTGDVVLRREPSSFSNNGSQLISDADGTLVHGAFGGNYLEAFDDRGRDAFVVPDCATSTSSQQLAEPSAIGGVAPDGTLVTGNTASVVADGVKTGETYVLLGLRDGADAASGDCPAVEERVAGLSRIETAIEVSEASFPQRDSADAVVVAVSTNYPDALAGGPLARKEDAPLLLTERDALDPRTRAEIERLGASRAILLGGAAALAPAVEDELERMGLVTDRIAGADRFETARLIARRVPATTVYVTEGANADPSRGWPDAVAVSGLAAFEQRPILLVTRDAAPTPTLEALAELGATDVVVVGGEVAVSPATAAALGDYRPGGADEAAVVREAGDSRFGTSVRIAARSVAAGASTRDMWFATGLAFPDALTAGPAVARSGGVLVLVHGRDPAGGPEVYDHLEDVDGVQRAWFVGGVEAITDAVADRIAATLGIT